MEEILLSLILSPLGLLCAIGASSQKMKGVTILKKEVQKIEMLSWVNNKLMVSLVMIETSLGLIKREAMHSWIERVVWKCINCFTKTTSGESMIQIVKVNVSFTSYFKLLCPFPSFQHKSWFSVCWSKIHYFTFQN